MYSFITKLAFPFLFIGLLSIDCALAQRLWDVRGLASSSSPNLRLVFPDNTEKIISRNDAIAIRDMVDVYSKLSGIYPQIFLQSTSQYNAAARYDNKTPVITIYMPMFDLFAKDKDIAAAVLGHEMAHLYLGHHESSKAAEIAGEVIGFIAEVFLEALLQRNLGISNLGTRIGSSLGAATTATFSRSQEIDADELGLKWASTAGYDSLGAIRLFAFFEQVGMNNSYSLLNTHPTNADRIKNIRSISAALKRDGDASAQNERALKDTPEIISLNNLADQDLLLGAPKSNAANRGIKTFNEGDYVNAKKDFEECATDGELVCLNNLGVIYLNGLGTNKDVGFAKKLFKQAGDRGLARAYKNYAASLGIGANFSDMVFAYIKASELGSPEAMGALAYLSLLELDDKTRGIFPREELLTNYAKVSAMRGVKSGQLALGSFYRNGIGVQKNLSLAEANLRLASSSDVRADGELFTLYDQDFNDSKLAQEYRRKIFAKKEYVAMDVVISNYCKGAYNSFTRSCVEWVRDSANAGATGAAITYGILLYDGVASGIKQDRVEGLSWILVAKLRGHKKAGEVYDSIQRGLSADEVLRVNKRATEIGSSFSKNTN